MKVYHGKSLTLPNLLGGQAEVDNLFQQLYDAEDTYYKEIFGSFKDPSGMYFYETLLTVD